MHVINQSFWVVVNKEGLFWKKNIGNRKWNRKEKRYIYPSKFTDVLGRAKIFESKRMAESYCDGELRAKGYTAIPINENFVAYSGHAIITPSLFYD